MNRRNDAGICAAAADVPFHPADYFRVGGIREPLQKPHGAENHTGRAPPALQRIGFEKGFLNRMEPAALQQPLDCDNSLACDTAHSRDTGLHRLAIDEHRAGRALSFAASELRACKIEIIA
jgi:hypothetical protein